MSLWNDILHKYCLNTANRKKVFSVHFNGTLELSLLGRIDLQCVAKLETDILEQHILAGYTFLYSFYMAIYLYLPTQKPNKEDATYHISP